MTGYIPTGLTTHTEVIDGITYSMTSLPATEALVIMPRLVKLLGEDGLTFFLASADKDAQGLIEESRMMSALLSEVASNAAEDDGLLVVKRLLHTTSCDRIKIGDNFVTGNVAEHFDEHFAGGYMHLLNVVIWATRCSFGGL